jgi:uncharacterized protein (DUF58 family)
MRCSPLAFALSALTGWCVFLGVLADQPELFMVALPLVGALLSARSPSPSADISTAVALSATRVCEGDLLTGTVTIACSAPMPLLEIMLVLPPNIALISGRNRLVLGVRPGEVIERTFHLRAIARGRCRLGLLHLRVSDLSGLAVQESEVDRSMEVEAYPARLSVRHLPRPLRPRSSFGNYLSPRLGDGLEPGDIRPFVAGDRVRHVNWRASLRLGRLHVTQYHQERNADVVLLLDTYAEAGGLGATTLDASVRAVAALAATYLSRRDRVGLVELGGQLRWIRPTSGRRQLESVLRALMPADVTFTYVVRHLDVVPPRVLPPRALVIAISPLLDKRFATALRDLAARRFDVFVLAISPIAVTRAALASSRVMDLACRLAAAERHVMLDDLRQSGLTIVDWDPTLPLDGTPAAFGRWRPAREHAL